jgi:agmatinase
VDRGDLPLSDNDVADDDAKIDQAIADVAALDAVPLAIGGDHAVTFPLVAAIASKHGPVSILHFDAHPDLYADFEGNPRSHASPFARIMEGGHAKRLVQVGIRTLNHHCREQADRFGVQIIPMAGFHAKNVPVLDGPLYISIDLDGIDPSEAPGVAHPEPGGLTVREVLAVLSRQTAPIVGADIVELNPNRDVNGVTAILAAKLVRELAALIHCNNQEQSS